MVKEAWCSVEVTELLQKKGANISVWLCRAVNKDGKIVVVPTHQTAMAWLREVHNIGIFPSTYEFTNAEATNVKYYYGTAIINLVTHELMSDNIMARNTYEEAVEAALKFALENLV